MPAGDGRYDTRWNEYFAALRRYKDATGHCNVISKDPSNRKLSRWVENQRMFFRKKKLPPARIAMLEDLGFEWERPHRSLSQLSKKATVAVPLELSTGYEHPSMHPDESATEFHETVFSEDHDISSPSKRLDGSSPFDAVLTV